MALKSNVYTAPNGLNALSVPGLAYRRIVKVERNGVDFDIVESTPGNRQVWYQPAGLFIFDQQFIGIVAGPSADPVTETEKIFIKWEE